MPTPNKHTQKIQIFTLAMSSLCFFSSSSFSFSLFSFSSVSFFLFSSSFSFSLFSFSSFSFFLFSSSFSFCLLFFSSFSFCSTDDADDDDVEAVAFSGSLLAENRPDYCEFGSRILLQIPSNATRKHVCRICAEVKNTSTYRLCSVSRMMYHFA
jgi:hypothetical protein